ncbi:hypothetical protein [Bifidobacterium breve]|uniref:hypothetical protein n=1 Tax=Bifidobacterium breve TaxID=1685 RepID=UPI0034A58ADD
MVEYQKKHILLTGAQADWLARRAETDGRTEAETLRAIIDAERSRDDPRIPLGLDADGSPVHWDWRNTDLRLDREAVHVLDRTLARILASGSPLIVFNPTKTLDIQPLADDPSLPDPIIHSGRADMRIPPAVSNGCFSSANPTPPGRFRSPTRYAPCSWPSTRTDCPRMCAIGSRSPVSAAKPGSASSPSPPTRNPR